MAEKKTVTDDSHLWDQLRKGSEAAFREVYFKYAQVLNNYGFKFTADHQLTEDCIQEIFIEIFRNHNTLGPTNNIKLYLFKALRRRIVKEIQKRKVTPLPDNYEVSFDPVYFENISEGRNHLQTTLQTLPPRQKELIFLKFYEDMDYEEICQIMDMNYQSVRNLMHRAIQTLRDKVAKKRF